MSELTNRVDDLRQEAQVLVRRQQFEEALGLYDEALTLPSDETTHELLIINKADVLIEGNLLGAFDVQDAMATAHSMLLATNSLMPFSLSPQELGARDDVERRVAAVAGLLAMLETATAGPVGLTSQHPLPQAVPGQPIAGQAVPGQAGPA